MTTVQDTTQLEFNQAMADFKNMFPTIDNDVIEAVLRSNQGVVDATIDQLLSMTTDNENDKIMHEPDDYASDAESEGGIESPEPLDSLSNEQLHHLYMAPTPMNTIKPKNKLSPPISPSLQKVSNSSESSKLVGSSAGSPIHVGETSTALASNTLIELKSTDNSPNNVDSVNVETEQTSVPLCMKKCWANKVQLGNLADDFLRLTPVTLNYPPIVSGYSRLRLYTDNEDEQIALYLQNEEFMAEIRWDKEFLSTLEKDSPPEEKIATFNNNRTSDDDAMFKERIRNMGKLSRKKFSQLAKVFTGRQKKKSSAKQLLTQVPRDSMLLQEEDSDGT